MKNHEGYNDPTASQAIFNVCDESRRLATAIHMIKLLCQLAGFKIVGRIVLEDVKSKKVYR